MSFSIANIASIVMPQIGSAASSASGASGTFQSMLSNAIGNVEALQKSSGSAVENFISGKNEDVHSVALAGQQAELAFELGLQVRNKVVSAYQEVMKMQL